MNRFSIFTPSIKRDLMSPVELRAAIESAFANYTSTDKMTSEWNASDAEIKKFIVNHTLYLTFIPLEQLGKVKRIFLIKKKTAQSAALVALQKVIGQKATQQDVKKERRKLSSLFPSEGVETSASASLIRGQAESGSRIRITGAPKHKKSTNVPLAQSEIPVFSSDELTKAERKKRIAGRRSKSLLVRSDSLIASESKRVKPQEGNVKKLPHRKKPSLVKSHSLAEIAIEKPRNLS